MEKTSNPRKQLLKHGVIMGMALLLLVTALVFFTTAWYTKMVNMAGTEFDAARWDFTANYSVGEVVVNVYEFSTLTEDHAAPGTWGWIPIRLSAHEGDTDVEYYLTVDYASMSDEFQKRFNFFYFNEAGERVDFPKEVLPEAEQVQMSGIIPNQNEAGIEVKLYWEWVYENPDEEATQEEKDAWDEFDTLVGKSPGSYVKDMNATISIVGVEVNYTQETGPAPQP